MYLWSFLLVRVTSLDGGWPCSIKLIDFLSKEKDKHLLFYKNNFIYFFKKKLENSCAT